MKGLFPEYSQEENLDYKELWESSLFVFDANVLLNLYRYQPRVRDELFKVLESLSNRIWIPQHAALEFQRNRLTVIAAEFLRFSQVRDAINDSLASLQGSLSKLQVRRNHSPIDADSLIIELDQTVSIFLKKLAEQEARQQTPSSHDPLKSRIDQLFEGKVGTAPVNQNEVGDIYKAGEARFKAKIPPGYCDAGKDKSGNEKRVSDSDEYYSGSIIYKRKYGDYLIWKQTLTYMSKETLKKLIFITDDRKEDWWLEVKCGALQKIGPRPELIDEARLVAGVESFLMYNPERFLEYAAKYLEAKISKETLEEVRDVSSRQGREFLSKEALIANFASARNVVASWLEGKFDSFEESSSKFPRYDAYKDGKKLGINVSVFRDASADATYAGDIRAQAQRYIVERDYAEIALIWIVGDMDGLADVTRVLRLAHLSATRNIYHNSDKVRIIIGMIAHGETDEVQFVPRYCKFGVSEFNAIYSGF